MDNIRKSLVRWILISVACLCFSHEPYTKASRNVGLEKNDPLVVSNATLSFAAKVFKQYSANNTKSMSVGDFYNLLKVLKIGQVYNIQDQKVDEVTNHKEAVIETTPQQVLRRSLYEENKYDYKTGHNQRFHNGCISKDRLLELHDITKSKPISTNDFIKLCPSLVYEVQSGDCLHQDSHIKELEQNDGVTLQVWLYGLASITVISLSSLLAIAIIPCLGKAVYNKVMSFLVALAVGTLAGDAFIHLIPHAFLKESHSEDGHGHEIKPLWKGVVIMAGIYVFFLIESFMKARVARHDKAEKEQPVDEECQSPLPTECLVTKDIVNHNHCSPDECNEAARTAADLKTPSTASIMFTEVSQSVEDECSKCEGSVHFSNGGITIIENVTTAQPPPPYTKDELQESENESDIGILFKPPVVDNNYSSQHNDKHDTSQLAPTAQSRSDVSVGDATLASESDEKIIDMNHHHHGHSHHGNKNINRDTSIAAVAWMVIVGDGFHNLSDGLAVGAAFSSSITTGLTTAIAVLCHELPHELGDFAILIKSGISFRQAVAYNLASALISYIGLIVGIGLGNLDSSHVWVLALTSGLFLYISLVTMLPELKSYQEEGGVSVFLSQNAGILTGVIIMLVIALFEKHD